MLTGLERQGRILQSQVDAKMTGTIRQPKRQHDASPPRNSVQSSFLKAPLVLDEFQAATIRPPIL